MNDNREVLTTLFQILQKSRDLPSPYLMTLIIVSLQPGISVNDLSAALNVPQQTASRYAGVLLGRYSEIPSVDKPFLRQTISEDDPRKRALHLTKFGENYLKKIFE